MYLVQLRLGSQSSFYKVYKIVWDYPINREYFKEVSIETETIVETIENGQGCDLKKNRNQVVSGLRFRVAIATLIATLVATLVETWSSKSSQGCELKSQP